MSDAKCQAILKARIQDGLLDAGPIYGDVRTILDEAPKELLQEADGLMGGFPCQDSCSNHLLFNFQLHMFSAVCHCKGFKSGLSLQH